MVTDADKFEMRCSSPKTLALIANSVVFVVIAGAMVVLGLWGVVLGLWAGLGILVFGLLALAFFLFGGFRWIWQLRHRGPVLEVGPAGFHDQRLSAEPIPWSVIDSISTRRMSMTWVLVLSMSPEARRRYVHSRMDSRVARRWYRLNGGVLVATRGLDRSFKDLVVAVDHRYRQRANQSALGEDA